VMLLFVIIASFSSHRYWNLTEPAQYTNQNSHFWKNVAIKGGLLLLFITGAGRFAFDRVLIKR
jgi:putative oxidoreductase